MSKIKLTKRSVIIASAFVVLVCVILFYGEDKIDGLEKAAEQGDARVQVNLGGMYHSGMGVNEDSQKAFYWYEKAVEPGNARAQFSRLGDMYNDGIGVKQDSQKAFFWYEKAATHGDTYAQFSLGRMYQEGEGVKQDSQQAFYWIKKAADQGSEEAQKFLNEHF
ncbi:MAG: sel1 repeat family protein [Elusimicrobiota bacterium]|jgi:TPR repeat protein|nr:sel1 repeat family protein [Elusimicrobiota bacterium]